MASAAFIEALPVIEFVAQLLGKDVSSRPLSDSDRVKVTNLTGLEWFPCWVNAVNLAALPYALAPLLLD